MSRLVALAEGMRPRQWTKNVLVFASLLPAGQALTGDAVVGALVAFGVFCLASSGVYLINDAVDVELDRAHPTKRARPIASGRLPVPLAVAAAVVLFAAALALSLLWRTDLAVVMAVYVVVQIAYCLGLKHEPVFELASVASGFLLRAMAGGVAAGIPLSQWFLLTAAFGSLFMAAGKRYGESRAQEERGHTGRPVVQRYSTSYLRFVWTLSATAVVVTYALWAFEVGEDEGSSWSVVSLVPFTLAILRYAVDVDTGSAEEPDVVVLQDRLLLALGVVWAASLAVAVYLA